MTEAVSGSALWMMGTVQVLVNGTMLAIVGGWIKSKDQQIDNLRRTVDTHHEQRLKNIEQEQRHAKDSRGVLYNSKIDKAECEKQHERTRHAEQEFRSAVIKLERISTKIDSTIDEVERIQAENLSQAKTLARVEERIKDVANGK
jgi:uncharacterized membrane protein